MSKKTASKEKLKELEQLQAKLEELEEKVKRNSVRIHNVAINSNTPTY